MAQTGRFRRMDPCHDVCFLPARRYHLACWPGVPVHHEVDEQRQRAGDGGELLRYVAAPRADRPLLDRLLEAVHRLALLAGRSPSSTGAHENAGGPRRLAERAYAV